MYTTNENATHYQWIDCDSGTPVSGATDKVFTPSYTGSFKLAIIENGCADTTACYTTEENGLYGIGNLSKLLVYPNPTTGVFIVENKSSAAIVEMKLFNIAGKLLQHLSAKDRTVVSLENYPAGVYIMQVVFSNGLRCVVKIVSASHN